MFYYIFIVLILVILVISGLYFFKNVKKKEEVKLSKVIYVSEKYMNKVIDESSFFLRMTSTDLLARNINTVPGYIKFYKDNLQTFNDTEKKILETHIEKLRKIKSKNLKNIEWKFAKVNFNIENGYPHTLKDVIVLSNVFFELSPSEQFSTLLHEQIHVFQRLYPIETEKLVTRYWNFKVVDKNTNFELARNNPDINEFVYSRNDVKIIQVYKNKSPSNIADSETLFLDKDGKNETLNKLNIPSVINQIEHPYEIMGVILPKLLITQYTDDSKFIKNTMLWISRYL